MNYKLNLFILKKTTLIFLFTLGIYTAQSQEMYFTNAPNGLVIRDNPSTDSNRIGKLPYGTIIELIAKTAVKIQIIDNEKTIEGFWVKIKFKNFPYIISNFETNENDQYYKEGYVFNKFIEQLNKATIQTTEIDRLAFNKRYKKPAKPIVDKITSQKEIQELLGSRLKWKNIEDLGLTIDEIIVENKQTLRINQKTNDYFLVAYYPKEEILLFEGGHTSDYSISLKTGEILETTGNPEYIQESPNKKYRLNGWFPGQECSSYFFQEKTENNYTYLTDFGWGNKNAGGNVCYFDQFCWVNDGEFIYSYADYSGESKKDRFFKGSIIKN